MLRPCQRIDDSDVVGGIVLATGFFAKLSLYSSQGAGSSRRFSSRYRERETPRLVGVREHSERIGLASGRGLLDQASTLRCAHGPTFALYEHEPVLETCPCMSRARRSAVPPPRTNKVGRVPRGIGRPKVAPPEWIARAVRLSSRISESLAARHHTQCGEHVPGFQAWATDPTGWTDSSTLLKAPFFWRPLLTAQAVRLASTQSVPAASRVAPPVASASLVDTLG